MHVILGLTKKIYEWLQFRQAIVDARDTAKEYVEFLKSEFKDEIHAIEGKREQAAQILKEIERVHGRIATAKIGRPQAAWVRKLQVLREESKKNDTSPEEAELYEQILVQVVGAEGTVTHMEELLMAHIWRKHRRQPLHVHGEEWRCNNGLHACSHAPKNKG